MRKVPLMDIRSQYLELKTDIDAAVKDVFERSDFVLGKEVEAFEREFSDYLGIKNTVTVASGTDALILILDALSIGKGDEVITTPFTFFATAESIMRVGAKPVFVDIEPETFNIDPDKIEDAITEKTKAIIPVHIFGHPAEMDRINQIGNEYDLFVIEDACQAAGAEYKGKKAGTLSDAAAFSFFPTKNLGCAGDGGAVTTEVDAIAEKIRLLRVHGSFQKYYHETIGYNSRLDTIQAAVLRIKLKKLDEWNERRRNIARLYNEALSDLPLVLPFEKPESKHIYHLYVIRVEEGLRDKLADYLEKNGVGTGIYYPVPLHLQEACEELGYKEGSLIQAERASKEVLALPMSAHLSEDDVEYVSSKIREFFNN
ncbi:MAG: DegT/DnrJ/EryC1/StrS family aminotransferase [Actinobacteria bacterium]|nr:DegT/DnrJ/EryC1/StrS family aminotransferase [Actinomycetota bacterium]